MRSDQIPNQMQQACLTEVGVLKFTQTTVPKISAEEVLIRVSKTGICGSDVSTFLGNHPYKTAPTVLGHEFSGEVVKVGRDVKHAFRLSDRVCSAAYANCTKCDYCLTNQHHLCQNKQSYSTNNWHGSFAQFVVGKPEKLFRLPSTVSDKAGAIVEPLSIAIHALKQADMVGRKMCVVGAGSIGLSILLAAKKYSPSYIYAIDVKRQQKKLALTCGADEFLLPGNLKQQSMDVVFLVASYVGALNDAIGLTKSGGQVVIVSYFGESNDVDIDQIVRRELKILGSALCEDEDVYAAIEAVSEDKVAVDLLISHEYALSEIEEAMKVMTDSTIGKGKIVLTPG